MIHIGIDTSNYKTSLAAADDSGRIASDISEYLDVPRGERGLRQSDAFFKHSVRLPELLDRLFGETGTKDIASIGVSEKPRRVEGSYMPCFMAGVNLAKVLSRTLEVPLYGFSHQEGHAAAVMESTGEAVNSPFIFMHLSGGTTEILKCVMDDAGYDTDIIGGTLDISFGQLLDRFGVALGLPFPSGMYIDKFAEEYIGICSKPGILGHVAVKDGYFNLSGSETRLMKFALSSEVSQCKTEISSVSYELMDNIADILIRSADMLTKKYDIYKVYMAGGVASSDTLRNIINNRKNDLPYEIVFGDKKLSGDNAVGTALLARRVHGSIK